MAQNCGEFCSCESLMDNTCYFGPDIKGEIIKEMLSSERADGCDRLFCVCDTHDFEGSDTFESILEARMALACDRTKKRGGGLCEPVINEIPITDPDLTIPDEIDPIIVPDPLEPV